ncbi:MAG: hypothetical protein RIT27_1036 [Pseudomonadota bacterium]|jgi:hypothetical protein
MYFKQFSSRHWFALALIQALLAGYFFSNIQTYTIYQNIPNLLFDDLGFNPFIIRTLFSDAMIILILILPFIFINKPEQTYLKKYFNNLQFSNILLVLMSYMTLILSAAGTLELDYFIYMIIIWWIISNICIAIHLFLVAILPQKWIAHIIATVILFLLWFNLNQIEQNQPLPTISQLALQRLSEPLEIKAFIAENNPLSKRITTFIKRYQQIYPHIKLTFINPSSAPAQIKAFQIEQEGELLLQYAGHITKVAKITDYFFTKGLYKLLYQRQTTVVFLQGHGERTLSNNSPFEYGLFGALLQNENINIILQSVPPEVDRKTLLIIANPRQPLTAQESYAILEYVKKGGNLLWLLEPILENDGLYGLNQLADFLGLKILAGRLWNETLKTNQTLINITNFSTLENMIGLNALFPETTALQLENNIFNYQSFLKTPVLHLKPFEAEKSEEMQAVFTIGLIFQRAINILHQRIAIIGDSDFISNGYLEKANNAKLAINLIENLTEDADFINLPIKKRRDTQLALDFNLQIAFTGFFLFILPTIFLIISWRKLAKQIPSEIGASL